MVPGVVAIRPSSRNVAQDARDDLADRADAVGQTLLGDGGRHARRRPALRSPGPGCAGRRVRAWSRRCWTRGSCRCRAGVGRSPRCKHAADLVRSAAINRWRVESRISRRTQSLTACTLNAARPAVMLPTMAPAPTYIDAQPSAIARRHEGPDHALERRSRRDRPSDRREDRLPATRPQDGRIGQERFADVVAQATEEGAFRRRFGAGAVSALVHVGATVHRVRVRIRRAVPRPRSADPRGWPGRPMWPPAVVRTSYSREAIASVSIDTAAIGPPTSDHPSRPSRHPRLGGQGSPSSSSHSSSTPGIAMSSHRPSAASRGPGRGLGPRTTGPSRRTGPPSAVPGAADVADVRWHERQERDPERRRQRHRRSSVAAGYTGDDHARRVHADRRGERVQPGRLGRSPAGPRR